MEMIIFVSTISLIFGLFVIYSFNKQKKLVKELKIGDDVFIDGLRGQIIEIKPDNNFVIKVEVSGLRLSKK
jgi:preprotein translocase subunit YajC